MSAPANHSDGSGRTPPRHLVLLLFGLLLALLVSGVFVSENATESPYDVPREPIGAYQQLSAEDLRSLQVADARVEPGALRHAANLRNRYALRPLDQHRVINAGELGPALPRDELAKRRVLALPVNDGATVSEGLVRGERVGLLWAPSAPDVAPLTLTDVLVLDWSPVGDDGGRHVVVAVPSEHLAAIGAVAGRSTLFVFR